MPLRDHVIVVGTITLDREGPKDGKWTPIDLDKVPLGHHVAFAPDLTPIAHRSGKRRTKDASIALGCHHPLIVPMTQLANRDIACSCFKCIR